MGWLTGLEPATSAATGQRSNQLSYSHQKGKNQEGQTVEYKIPANTFQLLKRTKSIPQP